MYKHYEMYYLSMFTLIAGCEWTLVLIPVVPSLLLLRDDVSRIL